MGDLSPHFSKHEFECKCGCGLCSPHAFLIPGLELLRSNLCELVGKNIPLHISSGHRCAEHNREEGGARNSQHLLGKAADVHANVSMEMLFRAALLVPVFRYGGIGIYEPDNGSFLHLDVRGYKSRWLNRPTQSLSPRWEQLEQEVRRESGWK